MTTKLYKPKKGFLQAGNVAFITIVTSTPIFLPGATNDLIRKDLDIKANEIAFVFSLYWLGSIIGAYISKRTNNHFFIQQKLNFSLLVTSLALGIIYIYPQIGLWIGAFVGGLVYGYSQPYTNTLIVQKCDHRIHGFAFGLKQASIPLATLFCSITVPLLAIPFGWRNIFAIISILLLIYSLIMIKYSFSDKTVQPPVKYKTKKSLPLNPHLLLLAFCGAFGAMIGNSLGAFLISSLSSNGISLAHASVIAAIAAMASVIVRIMAGIITDKSEVSPQKLLAGMFVFGMFGTSLLATSSWIGQILGALLAYGAGWGWAGLLHYVTGKSYPGYEGQATSVSQMGVSIGAALGPLLFGWIFTFFGSSVAWFTMTVAGALALLSVILVYKLEPREHSPQVKNIELGKIQ